MIKVLFYEDGLGFGGSLVSLAELLDGLEVSGGVAATVLTSVPETVSGPVLRHHSHRQFHRLFTYRTRFLASTWLSNSRLPKVIQRLGFNIYITMHALGELADSVRLYAIIRREKIDIVHCNNGWTDQVIRAARWAKRPCVLHFRGFPATPLSRRHATLLAPTVAKTIAISSSIADRLNEIGIPRPLVTLMHNPINIVKYSEAAEQRLLVRQSLGWGDTDVVVSIFGRVTPWKGQLEFLRAVQAISLDVPSLKVMIVGDESDASVATYRAAVSALADAPPLRGRTTFVGYQADPRGYYWASDVVVHSSIEPEPFGRVVTEAMACERAVIAMAEGGPLDIISDGHDGLLVTPRNIPALSAAIKRLAESADERARIGTNARDTVARRFSHVALGERMLGVYRSVMRDR